MLIWDIDGHNIRLNGVVKKKLDKFLGGNNYPNKNVTAAQAEAAAETAFNTELESDGYHIKLHLFSFPKKTEEQIPLNYRLWIGSTDLKPVITPGNTYWWETY